MSTKLFEYKRVSGDALSEHYENGSFYFTYTSKGQEVKLSVYSLTREEKPSNELYLGHTLEEIMDSPTDILGNELTKNGDPDYDAIRGVMPEITEDAYCFLSGAASHGGVVVDRFGNIAPQLCEMECNAEPMFKPASCDDSLSDITPVQYFLDGRFPILFNVFEGDKNITELMYFIDAGDPDRDPVVWIREKKFSVENPEKVAFRYGVREFTHGYAKENGEIYELDADLFYDTLAQTVKHWMRFTESGVRLDLPIEDLVRVTEGTMISAATTFTGPRPHYGHKFYGKELHDNFPPNYIWAIEAAILTGHVKWAQDIFNHLISYGLTDEGKFYYRQGPFIAGASAVEYSMILWLANRYKAKLFPHGIDSETEEKLCGMGNIILSHFIACPEFGGLELIKMCAEADNNVRVNVYLNNNLWSIRGLTSLAQLLGNEKSAKYQNASVRLKQNLDQILKEHTLMNTEYGDVPPFRFHYPAIPYTLSNCKTHLLPEDEEAVKKYFYRPEGRRDFDVTSQDITENTYANYRYYPETLSAMLLPDNLADGIFEMREKLGGNILGMTRFRSWIDNWPVVNYARYLLETDKIDKYLLLLYAHTLHHGHPELMCYYEQIKLFGKVSAHDCVPSLLTTPMMTLWALAYETVESAKLRLLAAVPESWFRTSFAAKGIVTSQGTVDIRFDGACLFIDFSEGAPEHCEIVLRCFKELSDGDITVSQGCLEKIEGNKVIVKAGVQHCEIRINRA